MGRVVPENGLDVVRELLTRNYSIMYVVADNAQTVEVLVIYFTRQFGGFEA